MPPKPRTESTWEQCLESFDWYSWPTADWNRVRRGVLAAGRTGYPNAGTMRPQAGLLPETHAVRTPAGGVPRAARDPATWGLWMQWGQGKDPKVNSGPNLACDTWPAHGDCW